MALAIPNNKNRILIFDFQIKEIRVILVISDDRRLTTLRVSSLCKSIEGKSVSVCSCYDLALSSRAIQAEVSRLLHTMSECQLFWHFSRILNTYDRHISGLSGMIYPEYDFPILSNSSSILATSGSCLAVVMIEDDRG